MKRTRPWKVPACYDGTRSSWQAEGTGTRAMYQARQRRMDRKAERLQDCPLGDATLRALPAACRSARTVQHDGPDLGGRTRCAVRTGAALLLLCVLGVRGMGENKKERWSERTKEE